MHNGNYFSTYRNEVISIHICVGRDEDKYRTKTQIWIMKLTIINFREFPSILITQLSPNTMNKWNLPNFNKGHINKYSAAAPTSNYALKSHLINKTHSPLM